MQDQFTRFNVGVSRLNKLINKLKVTGMQPLGLKAAHVMCIHQLACEPELSFPQLCERCDLDAGLISRTLKELTISGHIIKDGELGRYDAHYRLTKEGERVAQHIRRVVDSVIAMADDGIAQEELEVFYRVLMRLIANFEEMSKLPPEAFVREKQGQEETCHG